jgi:hypothetical protein
MSQPRINNIRSFSDVNHEVLWIHKNLTQLSNLLGQETTETLNFRNLSCTTLTVTGQSDDAITNSGGITSKNYISQSQGYRMNTKGEADFRYLYTDELHAKSFIADLEQALAGGQIISKSVAKIVKDFTIPDAGNTSTLFVEEFMGYTGHVFADGDMIRLRQFTRSSNTTVTVADVWGTVAFTRRWANGSPPAIGNAPVQQYAFTRSAAPNAGTGTGTIAKGTSALDYGVTGQGYYEVTAIDGANGANSPYAQCVTWTTHPASGCTVKTRFGNLAGITSDTWGALSGYGFFGNKVYLEGDCYIKGVITVTAGSNVESGATAGADWATNLKNIPAYLAATAPDNSIAITGTFIGFHSTGSTWPIRIQNDSGTGKFYAGDGSTKYMAWDGSDLTVQGKIQTAADVLANKRVVINNSTNEMCFYEASVADPVVRIGSDVNGSVDGMYVKEGSIYSLNSISGTASILGWNLSNTTAIGASFWATGTGSNTAVYAYADGGTTNYAISVGKGDINVASDGSYKINGTALAAGDIGATTVGANLFTLTNPSAITFIRINANNTISTLGAGDFRAAIDAAYEIHNLIDTTNHPVSGLTTGHFLKALSATTYGFAAHGLTGESVGISFGSYNSSGVFGSKTSGGATDDEIKCVALNIDGATVQVLTDQWVA